MGKSNAKLDSRVNRPLRLAYCKIALRNRTCKEAFIYETLCTHLRLKTNGTERIGTEQMIDMFWNGRERKTVFLICLIQKHMGPGFWAQKYDPPQRKQTFPTNFVL